MEQGHRHHLAAVKGRGGNATKEHRPRFSARAMPGQHRAADGRLRQSATGKVELPFPEVISRLTFASPFF
jgi:hypothetical protein